MDTFRESILDEAEGLSWELVYEDADAECSRFKRDEILVDIWWTTLTVGVMQKGNKTTFVRNQNLDSLIEILSRPEKVLSPTNQ